MCLTFNLKRAKTNLCLSFLRAVAPHGNSRHQKPRDQQRSPLQQLSDEQHRALLLPQEGEEEQGGEEEEADQGGHRHPQQLPVSAVTYVWSHQES